MSNRVRKVCICEYDVDPSTEDKEKQNTFEVHESELLLHGSGATKVTHSSQKRRNYWKATARVLQELFLPIGFPSSVNAGYLEYQFYDSLQGLCSYLRGVLCSAQVLQAAGVGKADATALSAAMTWALKDGASMIGGLIFSYSASFLFDSYVKEFRLFADLINDVGLTLDMLAPYFEGHLLLVSSAAGLCKTLCGLSAGATKSSITQHFALEGNMADLNAKESTQETLVSLIGMVLGITLAHKLQSLQETSSSNDLVVVIQWVIFLSLTLLHVWANWQGVKLLRLKTLNRERAEIALFNVITVLCELAQSDSSSSSRLLQAVSEIPTPLMVHESLLASTYKMLWPGRLRLDANLVDLVHMDASAMDEFKDERYVLAVNERSQVFVCLLVGAKCKDQMKAFLHATTLMRSMEKPMSIDSVKAVRRAIHVPLKILFEDDKKQGHASSLFMNEMTKKGWDVDLRLYVGFSRRRATWTLKSE